MKEQLITGAIAFAGSVAVMLVMLFIIAGVWL